MTAVVWLIVAFVCLPVLAQEKLTATVDKSTVRVGESLTLTLTFEGAASGVSEPQLSVLERLQRVGGPFTSTSFTLVNGRASSTAAFSYVLRATEAGKGLIGPARAKFRGKELTSNPISVTILSASAPAPGQDAREQGAGSDVFIRVVPDKTTAYVGEQITLTYKLYFAVQITSPEIVKFPRTAGFWAEEIPLPQNLPITDEMVGGRSYKVAVIRKTALFPTAAGELQVEPLVIQTKVEKRARRRSADPFDIFNDPFFQLGRQFEPLELASPGLTLQAKPLPQSDLPESFSGAVGSFKVMASLDRVSCRTDEAVTMTVEIEGTGNIKTLPEPKITFPPDIQRFDPEVTDDIRRNQARIGGRKTFKYVIIPRAPGTQVIPAAAYSYFDPARERYVTVTAPELRLAVERGTGVSTPYTGITVASKQGVENTGMDIAFAKTSPGRFLTSGAVPHQGVVFWLFTVAPWAGLAAFSVVLRRQQQGGPRAVRRSALRAAAQQVVRAERSLKGGNIEAALHAMAEALENLTAAALAKRTTGMTQIELEAEWQTRGLEPAMLTRLTDVRAQLDRARFASDRTTTEALRQTLQELQSISEAVERGNGKVSRRQ